MSRVRRARATQAIAKTVLGGAMFLSLGIAIFFVGYIFCRGIGYVDWEFLTSAPRNFMTEGGIYPIIVGTVWLTGWTALFPRLY